MRVTQDMTHPDSSRNMIEAADFIDADGTGIKAAVQRTGEIRIAVDSLSWPLESIWLDPDDAEAFGQRLIELAREARERRS